MLDRVEMQMDGFRGYRQISRVFRMVSRGSCC